MGTRSTTKIYDQGNLVLALYKQYDGYTEGWGKELKEFIKSGTFVKGISYREEKQFNGMGDFALQLVVEFKEGVGGLYATTEEDSQEYNYKIELNGDKLSITCEEEESFNEITDIKGPKVCEELADLEKDLKGFDYTYAMSDDHRVWLAGVANEKRIQTKINKLAIDRFFIVEDLIKKYKCEYGTQFVVEDDN